MLHLRLTYTTAITTNTLIIEIHNYYNPLISLCLSISSIYAIKLPLLKFSLLLCHHFIVPNHKSHKHFPNTHSLKPVLENSHIPNIPPHPLVNKYRIQQLLDKPPTALMTSDSNATPLAPVFHLKRHILNLVPPVACNVPISLPSNRLILFALPKHTPILPLFHNHQKHQLCRRHPRGNSSTLIKLCDTIR